MNIEKEFIPLDEALSLRELGFDEECICGYDSSKRLRSKIIHSTNGDYLKWDEYDRHLPVPTYSQAFRFFREKYDLIGVPKHYGGLNHPNMCFNYGITGRTKTGQPILGQLYDTYEEAELACLKKLIEIAKDEVPSKK